MGFSVNLGIPTDNPFKFLAVGGVVLYFLGMFVTFYAGQRVSDELYYNAFQIEEIGPQYEKVIDKSNQISKEVGELNKLTEQMDVASLTQETLETACARSTELVEQSKKIEEQNVALGPQLRFACLNYKKVNAEKRALTYIGIIMSVSGVGAAYIGFPKWKRMSASGN